MKETNCADRGSTGAPLTSSFHQLSDGKRPGSWPRRSGAPDCARASGCTRPRQIVTRQSGRKCRRMCSPIRKIRSEERRVGKECRCRKLAEADEKENANK